MQVCIQVHYEVDFTLRQSTLVLAENMIVLGKIKSARIRTHKHITVHEKKKNTKCPKKDKYFATDAMP